MISHQIKKNHLNFYDFRTPSFIFVFWSTNFCFFFKKTPIKIESKFYKRHFSDGNKSKNQIRDFHKKKQIFI